MNRSFPTSSAPLVFSSWRQFILAVALAMTAMATTAHAQETWTSFTPPTTENLWGICYGGSQFVAVGTGGTILTSPDGTAWTARTSGTTQWLLAVTHSDTLFVAVGDAGAILTSPDAITWTPRPSGTRARLNGIAYGGGRFLAVGETGTTTTSSDGSTWLAGNAGVTTFLRGVVYGNEQFIVSGGAGTLLSTRDGLLFSRLGIPTYGAVEALAWDGSTYLAVGEFEAYASGSDPRYLTYFITPLPPSLSYMRGVAFFNGYRIVVGWPGANRSPLSVFTDFMIRTSEIPAARLNAVTAGPSTVVAVGMSGSVLVSTFATKPGYVQIVPSESHYIGEKFTLTAFVPTNPPLQYRWTHDLVEVAGATSATLTWNPLRKTDAGMYVVTVSNSYGSNWSAPMQVTVPLRPEPIGTVDPAFFSSLKVDPWAIAVQPDGKIVVAAPMFFYPGGVPQYGVARLNEDGSVDDIFRVPHGGLGLQSRVTQLYILPDGRIAVEGLHSAISSIAGNQGPFSLLTLNSNGSLDRTDNFALILPDASAVVLPDGRTIYVSIVNNVASLTRRNADGTPDASYPVASVALGPIDGGWGNLHFTAAGSTRDDSGNSIFVASSRPSSPLGGSFQSKLFRLLPDGLIDPGFPLATVNDAITKIVSSEGKLYYESKRGDSSLDSRFYGVKFARLLADGAADPSYQPIEFSTSWSPYEPVADLGLDGSVLAAWQKGIARIRGFVDPYATRLVNLSVRTTAGTGDQTLIAGFVVAGSGGSRAILARGIGPGLVPLGLTASEVAADPQLALYRNAVIVATNNDWPSSLKDTFSSLGAFPLAPGGKDSALLLSLVPDGYTAQVTSPAGKDGIALVELYDAGPSPTSVSAPRIVNLSGRARVSSGNNALIAGFVVGGSRTKRFLIRAVGPGLASLGVSDALSDPKLTIYHGNEIVDGNDNWSFDDYDAFRTVGAFFLKYGSKDAALVIDLPPGVYSAVVQGVNDSTGTALVEIYEMP